MKKNICFFIVILTFLIISIICINNLYSNNSGEKKENVEMIQEEIIEILNKEDEVVAIVNNQTLTKKDVEWTKFFNDEMNDDEAVLETVEKNILFEEAKKQGIVISNDRKEYQESLIKGYQEREYTDEFLKKINMTKDEYIENIEKQINIITIVSEFKNNIYNDIVNNQLNCENEKVKKLVKEYPIKKEQFDNDEIEYVDLVNFRDSIITEYINYIISTYEIIYK